MSQQYSVQRHVIGSKEYDGGNHVWVNNRRILIEFDSDYYITRSFTAKNWLKKAVKEVNKIPNPVTVEWLIKHGYDVPRQVRVMVQMHEKDLLGCCRK